MIRWFSSLSITLGTVGLLAQACSTISPVPVAETATSAHAAEVTQMLRGLVRYPRPLQDAILTVSATSGLFVGIADAGSDPKRVSELGARHTPAVSVAISELAKYPEVVRMLAGFPQQTDLLGREFARSPKVIRGILDGLIEEAAMLDRNATIEWVRRLNASPAALRELVAAESAFIEQFQELAALRAKYQASVVDAERVKKTIAQAQQPVRKTNVTKTVYVVEESRFGYPFTSYYTVYQYTRSTPYPYRGYSGYPYKTVRPTDNRATVTVWSLPAYQMVHFVLTHADRFPALAELIVIQSESVPNPLPFQSAVDVWVAAIEPIADISPGPDRRKRLVRMAADLKQAFSAGDVPMANPGGCAPAVDTSTDSEFAQCPPPALKRLLELAGVKSTDTVVYKAVYGEPTVEERMQRARNIQGSWLEELRTQDSK